jgi:hypothetical protein
VHSGGRAVRRTARQVWGARRRPGLLGATALPPHAPPTRACLQAVWPRVARSALASAAAELDGAAAEVAAASSHVSALPPLPTHRPAAAALATVAAGLQPPPLAAAPDMAASAWPAPELLARARAAAARARGAAAAAVRSSGGLAEELRSLQLLEGRVNSERLRRET